MHKTSQKSCLGFLSLMSKSWGLAVAIEMRLRELYVMIGVVILFVTPVKLLVLMLLLLFFYLVCLLL